MDAQAGKQEAGAEPAAKPNADAVAAVAASVGMFRKRNRTGNLRKKDDDADDAGDDVTIAQKQKQAKGLTFTTKRDEKEDLAVKYEGSRALQSGKDDLVTRALETETQFDRDARALREQVLKQTADGAKDDGKYKGMNSYIDYRQGFRREQTVAAEKGTGAHGPLRGSAYARVTARFDYQPDVCKDYKETGFCSYGDSCKFMHDRGDYKSGWELEKQWEEEQKRKQEAKMLRAMKRREGGNDDDDDDDDGDDNDKEDDGLPFACYICREPWETCKSGPVVTRWRHYFCETCALKHNAKTGKCAVCEQATAGIFNVANDIVKRMKKAKQ